MTRRSNLLAVCCAAWLWASPAWAETPSGALGAPALPAGVAQTTPPGGSAQLSDSPASAPGAASAARVCPPPAVRPTPDALRVMAAQARDRGFLWRIRRDGHDSWLYGTLHVAQSEWLMPGPRVQRAMQRSDTLALELNLLDPQVMQVLARPASPARVNAVMTPQRREALAAQADKACIDARLLAPLRPGMQAMTLLTLAGREDGFYADYAIDFVLAGMAQAQGKPVIGLEKPEDQLALLTGGSSQAEGEMVDKALEELASGRARTDIQALTQVWARGDLATLDRYPEWCRCMDTPADRAQMGRVLDQRNVALARGIEKLHAEGRRVMAGIGALHMIGDQGLPALLQARGFEVLRVDFDRPLPGGQARGGADPGP